MKYKDLIHASEDTIEKSELVGLTILVFGAGWCGPCRIMEEPVSEVARANKDIKFVYVDTDVNVNLAMEYGIRSIPTVVSLCDGVQLETKLGALTQKHVVEMVAKLKSEGVPVNNTKDREKELRKIIKDAQEELENLRRGVEWDVACGFIEAGLSSNKEPITVVSVETGQSYHGYEGIGIIYTLHSLDRSKSRYKVK